MSLAGRTVVITGAASGIGAETAVEARRQGAVVIGVDRNPVVEADEWKQVELTDPASIEALVEDLPHGLHGIANIAGVAPSAPAGEVIKVNLRALQMFTERMIPRLADGASIVNLASSAGLGWADSMDQIKEFESVEWDDIGAFADKHNMDEGGRSYFFSKEALVVWTMQNRWTWLDRGIRMNAVSPGPVDTPILPDFIELLGTRGKESMETMDRPGHPTDVAPVVIFLLSDASRWFRGANLTVDGGLSSHLLLRRHRVE